MENKKNELNIILAGLQGTYWMAFCAINGFATAFLLHKNFTTSEIGYVMSLTNILAVIIQPLVASFADKSKTVSIKMITTIFIFMSTTLAITLIFIPNVVSVIAIVYIFEMLFLLLAQPLINAIPFQYINAGIELNFGAIRAAGSAFYGITSFVLGIVIEKYTLDILPKIHVGMLIIILIICILIKMPQIVIEEEVSDGDKGIKVWINYFKKYKKFIVFIFGIGLVFTTHNAIVTYMFPIVKNLNGTEADFGAVLGFAAAIEIPTMLLFSKIIRKFKIDVLVKVSAIFFTIKSIMIYFSKTVIHLYLVHLLQPFAFALYIVAAAYYVNIIMEPNDKIKGQTLLTIASTAGGVIGTALGGVIIDDFGISQMLLIISIISGIGTLIVLLSTEKVYI